jgi:hypothetical protein
MEIEQDKKTIKLHLDHYVHEMLTEYKDYIKESIDPSVFVFPISPGVILCPEVLDPAKQKHYRSFVAKLQFAASWIRFNISFVVSQLAQFCASAGTPKWSALRHVMEYLEGFPRLRLTYRRCVGAIRDLLSGFADSDRVRRLGEQLVPPIHVRKLDAIQQGSNHVEIQDAEDSVHGRGGVLFGFNGGKRDSVPPQAPRAYGVRPSDAHACLRRQHGVH